MGRINQKERILELLRNAPDHSVTCKELASEYLYHRAAARVWDLNREGHQIRFEKGENVMDGKYILVFDKELDRREFKVEGNQYVMFGEAV